MHLACAYTRRAPNFSPRASPSCPPMDSPECATPGLPSEETHKPAAGFPRNPGGLAWRMKSWKRHICLQGPQGTSLAF